MIPRIIHYCWFGGGAKDETFARCHASWKRVLPDYQIREWSDRDLPLVDLPYVREACAARKWAFVSDVFRLYALHRHGGVYLDTDVEIVKPLDDLLHDGFFIGSEKPHVLGTAVLGAVPGHPLVARLLSLYDGLPFVRPDGSCDLTPNTKRFVPVFAGMGLGFTKKILRRDDCAVYPAGYLSDAGPDSYAIHHFSASWVEADYRSRDKVRIPWPGGATLILRVYHPNHRHPAPLTLPSGERPLLRIPSGRGSFYLLVVRKSGD